MTVLKVAVGVALGLVDLHGRRDALRRAGPLIEETSGSLTRTSAGSDRLERMIRARGLTKRFGVRRVLAPVDLDLERGGFLLVTGPNGSGKTTLLRISSGSLRPSAGELEVAVDRPAIGFLAHEPLVYRELTPLENLELFGRLYRVPERSERIGMLLERYDLWEVRHERAGAFSRGMLQRLALCRTLLHDPELLLLDEPFNALDSDGAELLDRELGALAGRAHVRRRDARSRAGGDRSRRGGSRSHDAASSLTGCARAQGSAARAACAGDAARDAPVRRHGAGRLPFRAARPTSPTARRGPALGGDRLHGPARPDARLRRRARAGTARRARALAVRPGGDLDRQGPRGARIPRRRRAGGASRLRALLHGRSTRPRSPACCSPTSGSARSGRSSPRWRSPAGRASCSCRCSSCPLAIPIVVGGVSATVGDDPGSEPWLSRAVRRHLCDPVLREL